MPDGPTARVVRASKRRSDRRTPTDPVPRLAGDPAPHPSGPAGATLGRGRVRIDPELAHGDGDGAGGLGPVHDDRAPSPRRAILATGKRRSPQDVRDRDERVRADRPVEGPASASSSGRRRRRVKASPRRTVAQRIQRAEARHAPAWSSRPGRRAPVGPVTTFMASVGRVRGQGNVVEVGSHDRVQPPAGLAIRSRRPR
jgi:hypothetical protein